TTCMRHPINFASITSHVGIKGNKNANHAAKTDSLLMEDQMSLPLSIRHIKMKVTTKLEKLRLRRHDQCTETRSASNL
ncbi:hypothetical protein SK128_003587, partial [Halocaridina rubra]